MKKKEDKGEDRAELNPSKVILAVIQKTEKNTGYEFSAPEVLEVLLHTIRKNRALGKGMEYFWILFENELSDLVMRVEINLKGVEAACVQNP